MCKPDKLVVVRFPATLAVLLLAFVALFPVDAEAIPTFSRKYDTSCQTCHVQYPVLNAFGEAFRRNGFRFPSSNGSVDGDAAKEEPLALGQPENAAAFPKSVLPSQISRIFPLSAVAYVSVPYSLPRSDLRDTNGNAFNWDGLQAPISLYASGTFTDNLTYYAKATFLPGSAAVGPAFIVWSDIIRPRHLVNLSIGRLVAPQLTSFGSNGAYLADRAFPTVSVAGLFSGNRTFILGQGPVNGAELSGVALHRINYSLGWLASNFQTGLKAPTSEDFYGHLGAKWEGGSLDGEDPKDARVIDLLRPWAETSLTVDVFAYRGLSIADNYTNYPTLTPQRSTIEAVGLATRLMFGSFSANVILQRQNHFRPYAGSDPIPANPPSVPNSLPGIPDNTRGNGFVGSTELAYVLYPWLVPAVRAEYTALNSSWGTGNFARLMPGFSLLPRPNIRLYVYADMQRAHRTPPQAPGFSTNWAAASGTAVPPKPGGERSSVEAIVASASLGF